MQASEGKPEGFSNAVLLLGTVAALLAVVAVIVLGNIGISGRFPEASTTASAGKTTKADTNAPPTSAGVPSFNAATFPSAAATDEPVIGSGAPTTAGISAQLPLASVSWGVADAPVTIVVYSDIFCSHCQDFALSVERELETAYIATGKVRLVYKFVIAYQEESLEADQAAACAAEQGRFWDYYHLLVAQRPSPGADDLPVEKLQALAQQIGLDMARFNASLLSGKYEAQIRQNDQEGRVLGVTGAPTFFINGIKQEGATSLKNLQNIIDPLLLQSGK